MSNKRYRTHCKI